MPKFPHEALVDMFRNQPVLATELLTASFTVPLPPFDHVRFESADLSELKPTEFRADAVVALTSSEQLDRPLAAIIVEIQTSRDPTKCWSWPAYIGTLRARSRCPVWLLVVCPERETARWAAKPIALGHPGLVLTPLVLGPDQVPVVDTNQAAQVPELAVLAAAVHGNRESHRVRVCEALITGLRAVQSTDTTRAADYYDFVLAALPEGAPRHHLEALMSTHIREPLSDWGRRHFAEGKAEGKAEGEAKMLLRVLSGLGIELSEDERRRIAECTDIKQLEAWGDRAVTATTAEEIFKTD